MIAFMQDVEGSRWDDIPLFLAAYRERTLGMAAKRLGLDTSTLSRRLTAFESALGMRLFERSREGLMPTHAAELVLPAAEAMEAAHARFGRDASARESSAEGTVRLSAPPAFAEQVIAPMLPRLLAKHPRITLELDTATRAVDLTRREAELALRSVPPRGADLVFKKMGSETWVAAGAPKFVRKLGRISSWADAPWITWDRDLASMPAAKWVAEHVPSSSIALRTSSFSTQLYAAGAGLGLVLTAPIHFRQPGLIAMPVSPELAPSAKKWPTDSLWLVGHRALRDVPRVAAVWRFLEQELKSLINSPR